MRPTFLQSLPWQEREQLLGSVASGSDIWRRYPREPRVEPRTGFKPRTQQRPTQHEAPTRPMPAKAPQFPGAQASPAQGSSPSPLPGCVPAAYSRPPTASTTTWRREREAASEASALRQQLEHQKQMMRELAGSAEVLSKDNVALATEVMQLRQACRSGEVQNDSLEVRVSQLQQLYIEAAAPTDGLRQSSKAEMESKIDALVTAEVLSVSQPPTDFPVPHGPGQVGGKGGRPAAAEHYRLMKAHEDAVKQLNVALNKQDELRQALEESEAARKSEKAAHDKEVQQLQRRLLGTTRRLAYCVQQSAGNDANRKVSQSYTQQLEQQVLRLHAALRQQDTDAEEGRGRAGPPRRPRPVDRGTQCRLGAEPGPGAGRRGASRSKQGPRASGSAQNVGGQRADRRQPLCNTRDNAAGVRQQTQQPDAPTVSGSRGDGGGALGSARCSPETGEQRRGEDLQLDVDALWGLGGGGLQEEQVRSPVVDPPSWLQTKLAQRCRELALEQQSRKVASEGPANQVAQSEQSGLSAGLPAHGGNGAGLTSLQAVAIQGQPAPDLGRSKPGVSQATSASPVSWRTTTFACAREPGVLQRCSPSPAAAAAVYEDAAAGWHSPSTACGPAPGGPSYHRIHRSRVGVADVESWEAGSGHNPPQGVDGGGVLAGGQVATSVTTGASACGSEATGAAVPGNAVPAAGEGCGARLRAGSDGGSGRLALDVGRASEGGSGEHRGRERVRVDVLRSWVAAELGITAEHMGGEDPTLDDSEKEVSEAGSSSDRVMAVIEQLESRILALDPALTRLSQNSATGTG